MGKRIKINKTKPKEIRFKLAALDSPRHPCKGNNVKVFFEIRFAVDTLKPGDDALYEYAVAVQGATLQLKLANCRMPSEYWAHDPNVEVQRTVERESETQTETTSGIQLNFSKPKGSTSSTKGRQEKTNWSEFVPLITSSGDANAPEWKIRVADNDRFLLGLVPPKDKMWGLASIERLPAQITATLSTDSASLHVRQQKGPKWIALIMPKVTNQNALQIYVWKKFFSGAAEGRRVTLAVLTLDCE